MPDDRVIAGKYRLITKISEGGMGAVWQAEHLELNCAAAVKLLDPAFAESPEALARFKREAQSAASLRSTNIVQIFDFGLEDGVPYIAMELLRGQSLAERLSEARRLTPQVTGTILSQVAKAVTWAHGMGIVHRDLKPGNIFLSDDAGETVVKLVDFGIAKPLHVDLADAPVTLTGSIMGTPQYMSPEQASGRRTVDHRTDIWSFGIVAYECLTGYHAFAAETLGGLLLAICSDPLPVPSHVAQVPTGFDEWFARCTHRDPGLRFLSIAEAADVLRFVCGLEVSSSFEMPELYSERPPAAYAAMTPTRAIRPNAYAGASSTTDAPSIVTLAESMILRKRRNYLMFFGGFVGTGLLVASIFRFAHGSTSPSANRVAKTTLANAAGLVSPAPGQPRQLLPETDPSVPIAADTRLPAADDRAVASMSTLAQARHLQDTAFKTNRTHGTKIDRSHSSETNAPQRESDAPKSAGADIEQTKSPAPSPVPSHTVEDLFGLKKRPKDLTK